MASTTSPIGSIEAEILGAMILDRRQLELFERIGHANDFSPIGKTVFGAIREYYATDKDVRSCSRDVIRHRLFSKLANSKHETVVGSYLAAIPSTISVANIERSIREVHRKGVGTKLSLALANGAPEKEVTRLIQAYDATGSDPVGDGIDAENRIVDILDTAYLTQLTEEKAQSDFIRLWPKALNDRLDGGALRGHHVLLFARPETGKTLFAINLTYGFLKQGLSVLYVGNEEPLADYRDRVYARILRVPKGHIREERGITAELLGKENIGKVRIIEERTFGAVRNAVSGHDVVVIDQIRNMRLKSESRTVELEAAGLEARAIAKECNVLVVSVTQAGDSASGKVYLDLSDVDSSKTGIPASADLMIGLGADHVMRENGMLGISLCKNKLSGLHDKFSCAVNYQTGVIDV